MTGSHLKVGQGNILRGTLFPATLQNIEDGVGFENAIKERLDIALTDSATITVHTITEDQLTVTTESKILQSEGCSKLLGLEPQDSGEDRLYSTYLNIHL